MKAKLHKNRWLQRRLQGEGLESRCLLSAVGFVTHDVVAGDNDTPAAHSVHAADFDGDDDVDLLCVSRDDKIAWYENTDGRGTFGPQQVISRQAYRPESVYTADMDGDGDMDVLAAADKDIGWFENVDGNGTFGPWQVITTEIGFVSVSVFAADVDGDGDMDVLSSFPIAWYENTDGAGTFGPPQGIFGDDYYIPNSVYAADVDGDGDVDVLSTVSWYQSPYPLVRRDGPAWYENTNGQGTFGDHQVITTEVFTALSVYAADVDGDGDVDVLSAGQTEIGGGAIRSKIAWYENRLAGDADDDAEVDFADFVALADNFGRADATWEDGDFNGDGAVDFSDFAILANNFGQSRQGVGARTAPATTQSTETRSPANTSATGDLFERFDVELTDGRVNELSAQLDHELKGLNR